MSNDNEVLDLDVLRPKKRSVKIGGKEIDVSYIPVAITWEIDRLVRELMPYDDPAKIEGDETATRKILDLSCELCAAFCYRHEELDADWFRENASADQVSMFVEVIKETLTRAYDGVEAYQGNGQPAKQTTDR